MTWFKVDDSFYDHPKVFDAPDCAVALWTRAGTWSARNLTNGFVPTGMPARLCDDPDTAVRELLRRGLWKRASGGWRIALRDRTGRDVATFMRDEHRQKIPADLRQHVLDRDGHRCRRCGATEDLAMDHIYPWSLGGPDTEDNLQTLCRLCNSTKGARV